ncbi:MAG TPA: translation elongation factor Ts [Caulobacteraceae bacterium]|nr:translation elongation factor Ts [Caulobacteraceae bacterium]
MADITASMVKDLRETTGAGMMDCKKALQETGGDAQAAIDWLRTKGLAKAAKKADRVAAEGAVALATRVDGAGMTGALIELNAETDFVARNEIFQGAARKIAVAALDIDGDADTLRAAPIEGHADVSEMINALVATIGENMMLRRLARFTVSPGAVAGYIHSAIAGAPDLGRIGVMVAVEGDGDQATLKELARNIALHAAATNPLSLSPDDLDPANVEKEKAILTEQAAESGKPANVVEKMVEGRIRKWMEEVVLLKQAYVKNPDQTIEQLVAETAKAVGSPIKVVAFARLALGEGVEKKSDDFAAEVAAMTGGS